MTKLRPRLGRGLFPGFASFASPDYPAASRAAPGANRHGHVALTLRRSPTPGTSFLRPPTHRRGCGLEGLVPTGGGHCLSHRRCTAGQPRASERSSRRPGDPGLLLINSHAESVRLTSLRCERPTEKVAVTVLPVETLEIGRLLLEPPRGAFFNVHQHVGQGFRAVPSRTLSACNKSIGGPLDPGRRSLRELALGYLAGHLRCEIHSESEHLMVGLPPAGASSAMSPFRCTHCRALHACGGMVQSCNDATKNGSRIVQQYGLADESQLVAIGD